MKVQRLALSALVLLACSDSPTGLERDTDAVIQTEELRYTLTVGDDAVLADIDFAIHNGSSTDWVLEYCGGIHVVLQKHAGDNTWQTVYDKPVNREECDGQDVVIAAGGSWEHTYRVFAGRPGAPILTTFEDPEPGGVYRMRFEGLLLAAGQTLLDEGLRVSNPFEFVVERYHGNLAGHP